MNDGESETLFQHLACAPALCFGSLEPASHHPVPGQMPVFRGCNREDPKPDIPSGRLEGCDKGRADSVPACLGVDVEPFRLSKADMIEKCDAAHRRAADAGHEDLGIRCEQLIERFGVVRRCGTYQFPNVVRSWRFNPYLQVRNVEHSVCPQDHAQIQQRRKSDPPLHALPLMRTGGITGQELVSHCG